MDISKLELKTGDIKVDSDDMKLLFTCLQKYHSILCCSLEMLSEQEKKDLEKGIEVIEYMQNKYLLLGHLRNLQNKKYAHMKWIDSDEYLKSHTIAETEREYQEAVEEYVEAKRLKEELQEEIDKKRYSILY